MTLATPLGDIPFVADAQNPLNVTADISTQSYDVAATADAATVAAYSVANLKVEFTDDAVAIDADLNDALLGSPVALSGTASADGSYSLAGTSDLTLGGFTLTGATVTLSDAGLACSGEVAIPNLATVGLSGQVDDQGSLSLTGTADVTAGGFTLPGAVFMLDATGLMVEGHLTIAEVVDADLSGTAGGDGQFRLAGTADITVAGFPLPGAAFTLTNDSLASNTNLTVAATRGIGGASVNFSDAVDTSGQYTSTGTSHGTVAAFGRDAGFTLKNTGLTVAGTISVGSTNLSLSSTADSQGQVTCSRVEGDKHTAWAEIQCRRSRAIPNFGRIWVGTTAAPAPCRDPLHSLPLLLYPAHRLLQLDLYLLLLRLGYRLPGEDSLLLPGELEWIHSTSLFMATTAEQTARCTLRLQRTRPFPRGYLDKGPPDSFRMGFPARD